MATDVMSITVPPDPYYSGTLSGDMILNSAADLNPGDLYDVALHEAGLALGLSENDDPDSVMYPVINPQASLSPGDIASIQALYGSPAPDPNGSDGTFATATPMSTPPLYIGTTPLVAYGDRTSLSDVNVFSVHPPLLYSGPVTFQLQTSGISFMQPRLEVYDQNFNLLGEAQSSSVLGDVISVQLANVNPFERYYIQVDSPEQNVFGMGRYALSVTFDGRSLVNPAALPSILSGPYESLSAGNIAALLADPLDVLFNSDLHTNDTFLTAEPLQTVSGYPANSLYEAEASLAGPFAAEIYRIQAPQAPAGQSDVLAVSLTAMPVNGIVPVVSLYNAGTALVPAQVLLNGNGTYLVQATGLSPGATYYLRVSAAPSPAGNVGNYALVADFAGVPAQIQTFAGGTLGPSDPQDEYTLYVAQTQLFQFVLSSSTVGMATGVQVVLEIYDSTGQLVFTLVGQVGETVSGAGVLLDPGQYSVQFSVVNTKGAVLPTISFSLNGATLSDPIGPSTTDPTDEPMYPCPGDPSVNCYCYPNGTYSTTPYQFTQSD